MPNEIFQVATVARVFADEVELAEALGYPEISALDVSERKWRSCLQAKAKAILEDAQLSPAISLHRRKLAAALEQDSLELQFGKTLAEFCFGASGAKDRLVRLDMSEYGNWGAAQRLLHGPQGRPADWIERVRRQPFCVVLFDEFEKAAPEVFDVLLGLLDEGRLTDRFGRVTWFRSAIIIMTSNLGASASGSAGFTADSGPNYESEISKFFRPEFFNRLDSIITFKPLVPAEIEAITRKELSELVAREGLAAANIQVTWSEKLVATIAREGYDHRFGARPLQRVIEQRVAISLARWRVANAKVRNITLHLESDEQGLVKVKVL